MIVEKLKKTVQQNKNNDDNDQDQDFIKKLQTKIMLVTRHPEIKDPKKKIKVNKCKFKYSSIKDVFPPKEVKKEQDKSLNIWKRIWMEGDAKLHEKRICFNPQKDISIPAEEEFDEFEDYEQTNEDEIEYVSRNKVLQDKYDQDFHSHVISTGTVSLVADSRKSNVVDRANIFQHDQIYLEDSDISSDSDLTQVRFRTPKTVKHVDPESSKENENISSKDINNIVASALSQKLRIAIKGNSMSRSSGLHSSNSSNKGSGR